MEVSFYLPTAGYLCWNYGFICAPCPPGTYLTRKNLGLTAECTPCPPGEKKKNEGLFIDE